MYYLDRSHKPEALLRAESPNETDFCPSEYNMGHEPGSDIRVAVFEGKHSPCQEGREISSLVLLRFP